MQAVISERGNAINRRVAGCLGEVGLDAEFGDEVADVFFDGADLGGEDEAFLGGFDRIGVFDPGENADQGAFRRPAAAPEVRPER